MMLGSQWFILLLKQEAEPFRGALLEREDHTCRLLLTYFFTVEMFLEVTCTFCY